MLWHNSREWIFRCIIGLYFDKYSNRLNKKDQFYSAQPRYLTLSTIIQCMKHEWISSLKLAIAFFSLFIPAVFFRCSRKLCRRQSIHSCFFMWLYNSLFVTWTTCFDLYRPSLAIACFIIIIIIIICNCLAPRILALNQVSAEDYIRKYLNESLNLGTW